MALYRETATGFLCEYASNPGAGYTAISAQPTDTIANRVTWWRGLDTYGQITAWHPSEYRSPQDPAEATLDLRFSQDAAFISADASGTVTNPRDAGNTYYLGATADVRIYRGVSDVTVSEGWVLTKVDDACTSTLSLANGVNTLYINSISSTQGSVTITATRTGVTRTRVYRYLKVLKGADGGSGIVLDLTNDSHSVPTDSAGNNGNYTGATSTANLYSGSSDVSASATWNAITVTGGITRLAGETGNRTYTVAGMTADTGTVTFSATYGGTTYTAVFTVSKTKAGSDGTAATVYSVVPSVNAISKAAGGTVTPTSVTFTAYKTVGSAAPAVWSDATRGYIKVETSTDGTTWTVVVAATTQLNTSGQATYSPVDANAKYIRASIGLTSGFTTPLDVETIPIVSDGATGSAGPSGQRGSRQILVTTATGAWDDLTAWNGIVSQTGTNPVPSDLVTIAKTDGSVANSKFYTSGASPGVWTAPTAYINGSLLVTGTVGANQLAAGSVTTNKLTVGSGGNWLAGSGPTSGSEIAYWNLGYNDTGLTATKAAGVAGEYPTAGASVKVSVSGTPASGKMISLDHANMYPVMAGQKYEISAYLSGGSLSVARVILAFFNASGTYISETASADVVVPAASSTLANWARAAAIITAPANATQAYVIARGVCNGVANPKLCLTQAYFGKAGPNQTEFSDWSPSGVLTQIDGSGIKTATITADRLVAGTITAASGVIGSIDASKITTGTLSANYISGGTINGSNVTVTNLNATNITGGTLSVDRISANSISGGKITIGGIETNNLAAGAVTWIDSKGRVRASPLSQTTTSGVEIEIAQSTAPANSNRGAILITCLLDVSSPSYGAAPTQACNLFIYRGGTLLDYQGIYVVSQYYHQMALSFVDTSAPTSATTYYFKWRWTTGASGCLVAGSITLMELKR